MTITTIERLINIIDIEAAIDQAAKEIDDLRLKNHRLRNLLVEVLRCHDRTDQWSSIVRAELDKEEAV